MPTWPIRTPPPIRMPPPLMRIAWPPPIPPPWKPPPPPPPKPRASADEVVMIRLAAPSVATAAMANIEIRILVNMALSLGCFAVCEFDRSVIGRRLPSSRFIVAGRIPRFAAGTCRSRGIHLAETSGGLGCGQRDCCRKTTARRDVELLAAERLDRGRGEARDKTRGILSWGNWCCEV